MCVIAGAAIAGCNAFVIPDLETRGLTASCEAQSVLLRRALALESSAADKQGVGLPAGPIHRARNS